jgi:hypothetical protein
MANILSSHVIGRTCQPAVWKKNLAVRPTVRPIEACGQRTLCYMLNQ